jgi:hypothetical protein
MSRVRRSGFRAVLSVLLMASFQLSALPVYLGAATAEVQGKGLTVWIPPKMLGGERYSGVVIVPETSDHPREVLLLSSSPAVVVPGRVSVGSGMHQAEFAVDVQPDLPLSAAATVSAVMGGAFDEAGATLYDRQAGSNSMVRLLAFNSTSLSFARIVALAGQPAVGDPLSSDTVATLVYQGGSAEVTIDGESGYGVADIPLVDGANRISVFGRPGEEIVVTRTPIEHSITVRVSALSAIPAWTPEWGYQRSWVLVDAERNGKPVRENLQVIATSSNPDVLEVEKEASACRLPCAVPVRGHSEGEAQVGVQVTGIGGGTVTIATVTPARYMASQADVEGLARKYIAQSAGTSGQFVINSAFLSFHASEKAVSSAVTDGPLYGLVGHYATLAANYTKIEVTGNTTALTPAQVSKVVPLVIPEARYYMSPSDGPAHTARSFFSGLMRGDAGRGGSALTGEAPSAVVRSAPVGIGSSHASMSSFEVRLSAPVGPAELKGRLDAITLQDAGIQLAGYLVDGSVRGYPSEGRGVSIAVVPSSAVQIPQARTGLQLLVDVPPIAYPAEGFVFAAHVAQGGLPLQRVDPLYELGRPDPGMAGEVQEIDSVFIHPGSRQAARVTVSAVMNAIGLDVVWPQVLKLDRPYDMQVTASVDDARIQVSGDVRGEPSAGAGTVTLYPAGAEGDRKVVVTASKAGWAAATAEKVLAAKRFFNMTIDAVDADGNAVSAPFVVEYETVDGEAGTIRDSTPYTFDVRPFASKPLLAFGTAPAETNDGSSYVYRSTRETANTLTGVYERQIRLTVIGGAGTGHYLPGQGARIEADPDSQTLGFAVVERFSHWEYDSGSVYMRDRGARAQDIIAGDTDATMTAVYVTDFTTLAVLILSTAAAVGAYAYREEIRTILEAYRRRV